MAWKQLFDPVLPGIFLAWAERTDIAVASELIEAVKKRGVQVGDWKKLYDDAMELRKREATAAETQIADWRRLHAKVIDQLSREHSDWLGIVEAKDAQIAALQTRLGSVDSQANQPDSLPEQEIGARARDSLLKLVIGMAVAAYVYDPKAARSDKPSEIASDLERAGVSLDVDTVRKWLREAAELLPPRGSD